MANPEALSTLLSPLILRNIIRENIAENKARRVGVPVEILKLLLGLEGHMSVLLLQQYGKHFHAHKTSATKAVLCVELKSNIALSFMGIR